MLVMTRPLDLAQRMLAMTRPLGLTQRVVCVLLFRVSVVMRCLVSVCPCVCLYVVSVCVYMCICAKMCIMVWPLRVHDTIIDDGHGRCMSVQDGIEHWSLQYGNLQMFSS